MFKRFSKKTFNKDFTQKKTAEVSVNSSSTVHTLSSGSEKSASYPQKHEDYIPPRIFDSKDRHSFPPSPELREYSRNPTPGHESGNGKDRQWGEEYHVESQQSQDFKKGTFASNLQQEEPETTIGQGVSIKGTLTFQNYLCIHGHFEGELISDGKLSVGVTGVVKANISLREAIIEGHVEGNVRADRVELRGDAEVCGDILAKSLSVDEGATIIGQVKVVPGEHTDKEESGDDEGNEQ